MTIIVEDGTAKTDSETYCTVAYVRDYCEKFGYSLTGVVDLTLEQKLRHAQRYLSAYGARWQGERLAADQALDWPRSSVVVNGFDVANDAVPAAIMDACANLAYQALSGPLTPNRTRAKIRSKVGPIESEYDPASPEGVRYVEAAQLIVPYLARTNPFSVRLERS